MGIPKDTEHLKEKLIRRANGLFFFAEEEYKQAISTERASTRFRHIQQARLYYGQYLGILSIIEEIYPSIKREVFRCNDEKQKFYTVTDNFWRDLVRNNFTVSKGVL